MARVTVEDCIDQVNNRFELVLLATKRARQIARGATPLIDEENDKPTVIALREIAEGHVDNEFMQLQELAVLDEEQQQAEEAAAAFPAPPAVQRP